MENEHLIRAELFCIHHNVELGFIQALNEQGLIEISFFEEVPYLQREQLKDLETITRLYLELGINLEGIDVILQLLGRIQSLKEEVVLLRNRLDFYES